SPRGVKNANKSKWAREDSNLQPDRYERSALTVELRARGQGGSTRDPNTMRARGRQPRRRGRYAENGARESAASSRRSLGGSHYMRNKRLALPLRIFTLSSSHSGTVSIHCAAGLLATKGQSTANRMRSMPISMTQHNSAGLEKLPLVVM